MTGHDVGWHRGAASAALMRAVVMRATGGADVLEHVWLPVPEPGDGEVLIEVRAAAVNPVDWKYRRGLVTTPLPAVPGSDVAGVVVASRSREIAVGEAVCGMTSTGGYAELAVIDARHLAPIPDHVPVASAAAAVTSGLTAWQAVFDHAAPAPGQTVLVTGAAGGVGHLAVQFAALAGARVIGTGSARNREFVLGLGADRYVDYTRHDITDVVADVDAAIDTVGGATTPSALRALRPSGTLVGIVYPKPDTWPVVEHLARGAHVDARHMVMRPDGLQLRRILGLVADGAIHVTLADDLTLTDAARAQQHNESRRTRGKLVLTVAAGPDRPSASDG